MTAPRHRPACAHLTFIDVEDGLSDDCTRSWTPPATRTPSSTPWHAVTRNAVGTITVAIACAVVFLSLLGAGQAAVCVMNADSIVYCPGYSATVVAP